MHEFVEKFLINLKETSLLEFIAVIAGIASVWFSRIENIWVYPTGLVNTILYIYISFKYHLIGEASVNFYYTIMSVYGWWMWARKDKEHHTLLHVTFSSKKEWVQQMLFFTGFYAVLFCAIALLQQRYFPNAIPWADAFASATAYTGMWLMAKKKVESWWWWILTNIMSIPLYYIKGGLAFTSVYYVVLLVLAVFGWIEWQRRGKRTGNAATFALENS